MQWQNKEILLKKSSRKKTLNIVLERDCSISVLAPKNIKNEEIIEVLNSKEYEITQKIIQWKETHENKIVRRFVAGQSFMYLGKNYSLNFVENQKTKLQFRNNKFLMNVSVDNPRQEFINFYKKQAKIKIKERVDYYKSIISIKPTKVEIRDIQNRWGSCTPKGEIFYHWKCIMAPLNIIDYIVVHELVHLEFPNHSREFWYKVGAILPDYENSKKWLKINGIKMEI